MTGKESYKKVLLSINSEVFEIFFLYYLIVLIVDSFSNDLLSNIFNTNYLLIIIVLTGVINLTFDNNKKKIEKIENNSWLNYLKYIGLGLTSACIIFIKNKELGWMAWILAVLAGFIIVAIYYLLTEEQEEESKIVSSKTIKQQVKKVNKVKKIDLQTSNLNINFKIFGGFIFCIILVFYLIVNFVGVWAFLVSPLSALLITLIIFFFINKTKK